MIKQIKTKACETTYDVDGVQLKLWAITGGTPCLDFAEHSPYSKRFPQVTKYGDGEWKGTHYKCQNPNNIQGITFNDLPNGENDIYDFIKTVTPMKELAEKRYNELPLPISGFDFWGYGKTIQSKRVHDKENSTYVKAKIEFRKYMISPITFEAGCYCGRNDDRIKLFSSWWKTMQSILSPIFDSGKYLWNELSETEYNSICSMIADKPILDK